jgi:hypothetical protein
MSELRAYKVRHASNSDKERRQLGPEVLLPGMINYGTGHEARAMR